MNTYWRRLEDNYILLLTRGIEDVLQIRLENVLKMSWKRLGRRFEDGFKTSSRLICKTSSSRRLEDVLKDVLKISLKEALKARLEDVLKTSWRHLVKTFWGRLEDVFGRSLANTSWRYLRRRKIVRLKTSQKTRNVCWEVCSIITKIGFLMIYH